MCADPDSPNLVLEDMFKARDGLTSVKSHNSVARYVTDTVRKTILNSVNPVRAPPLTVIRFEPKTDNLDLQV